MASVDNGCQGSSCPHYRRFYTVDRIKNCDSYYTPNFSLSPNENCTHGVSTFAAGVTIQSLKICPLKK